MKAYVILILATVLGAVLLDLYLVHHFRPTVGMLEQTTIEKGKMALVGRRGGWVAKVNGKPLMCAVDFIGVNAQCRARIPELAEGMDLTVAFASVPALAGGPVAMSIAVDGRQVYARTAAQVIDEYTRSSRRRLLYIPGLLLCAFILASPLFFFHRFAAFLSSAR